MSGTSADGVDAAIVDLDGRRVRVVAFATYPYPPSVRRALFRLFDPAGRVDELCRMNFVLGELFAEALLRLARDAGVDVGTIDLVGSHGQTVRHEPRGRPFAGRAARCTLQIAEPAVIAERTGVATVADFRPRDVAAGGEGAPLVPYADWFLFADRRRTRAVQNVGGIANVTFLPAGGCPDDIRAFDTGPGNMVLDRVAQLASGGRRRYDADGRLAARGRVDEALLAELMRHPFLRRRPPRSAGREEFGVAFADALRRRAAARGTGDADLAATVTAFTASSIAEAYRRFGPPRIHECLLCGGGARNPTLRRMIAERLPGVRVRVTDELGVDADAKEAVSFAILAAATARGEPSSLPAVTGASRPAVLGKLVPGWRGAPGGGPHAGRGGRRR